MGIFDQAKDLAAQGANQFGDQIDQGIDQAGDFINEKTGGQFGDQIEQGKQMAKDGVENFGNQDDTPA